MKSTPLPRELITKPIEELQVGEWVLAGNPLDEPDLAFGEEVDPETWRRIELRAPKPDGSHADVVLLRPLFWLEDEDVVLGRTVEISVPECGIDGEAEVLAIGPCPAISPQPHHEARILTGTFRHHNARVFDLQIGTESKPLGTTGNHPFWSEDRQDFVRADELRVGERLKNADGTFTTVAWINERPGRHTVYNLEVQVDHTYHVGQHGVLVHNARSCTSGNNAASAIGRLKHATYNPGPTYRTPYRLPSGRIADAVDLDNRIVRELKPGNPAAIKKGLRQVSRYLDELKELFPGNWTSVVDTY